MLSSIRKPLIHNLHFFYGWGMGEYFNTMLLLHRRNLWHFVATRTALALTKIKFLFEDSPIILIQRSRGNSCSSHSSGMETETRWFLVILFKLNWSYLPATERRNCSIKTFHSSTGAGDEKRGKSTRLKYLLESDSGAVLFSFYIRTLRFFFTWQRKFASRLDSEQLWDRKNGKLLKTICWWPAQL